MATNYEEIARDHRRYYGEGDRHLRIYRRLYADKTHFVYELIQNADDAESKHLALILREGELLVWNDGRSFNEDDVKGICSIGLSEKDLTQIGTFGIGFKAVYAYTDLPEIYSGEEHFRIRRYVEPENADEIPPEIREQFKQGKTVFRLPFKSDVDVKSLRRRFEALGHHTLLFLRHLNKVIWRDERDGQEGIYSCSRSPYDNIPKALHVELSDQTWVVFRKEVVPPPNVVADMRRVAEDNEERERIQRSSRSEQPIEVAFRLQDGHIVSANSCVLFAYLPTEKETHLRFLIQARYQTTPARDNIPTDSPWNTWLIQETANFLPEILSQVKTTNLLTPTFFEVLPIDDDGVPDIFQPIVESLKRTLIDSEFIPTDTGRYTRPKQVFHPHSESLRKLLADRDLTELTGVEGATWLHHDIREIKEHSRRFAVVRSAGVQEINAGQLTSWLIQRDTAWFESKDDAWIRLLYAYLNRQKAEQERLKKIPLVRLESGKHVCAANNVVFFPPEQEEEIQELTPFLNELPILRRSLLEGEERGEVKSFMEAMNVKPLRPAELIRNFLLPQYRQLELPDQERNRLHLQYLKNNLEKVSSEEKLKLLWEIRRTPLLMAYKGVPSEEICLKEPNCLYLPQTYTGNSDLEIFFGPHTDVWFVDKSYCGPEQEIKNWYKFLKDLEAADTPRRQKNPNDPLSYAEKRELRGTSGHTNDLNTTDWLLDGLDVALQRIADGVDEASDIARVIWQLLIKAIPHDQKQRDKFFQGVYKWFFYTDRPANFDATFYRQLKKTSWLPDEQGQFHRPTELFSPTPENRRLLGDSVAYLHPAFDISDKQESEPDRWIAEKLGIHLNADTESVLKYLKALSENVNTDIEVLRRIYRFLDQQGASRQEEFKQYPLLLTPTPQPRWWQAHKAFWEDEGLVFGNLRGYLKSHYPEALKPFFIGVGVSERAAPLDYVRAIRCIALQGQLTEEIQERLHALYRRLWYAIQEGGEWINSEEWHLVREGRYWLGKQGNQSNFFLRTQLVWNDHDYLANLFAEELPFWPLGDLQDLADHLEMERCSQACVSFRPIGEQNSLAEWTEKLRNFADDLQCFLSSPRWIEQRRKGSHLQFFSSLQVCSVKQARVTYTLKGCPVTEPEPRLSHLDESGATLWLALDADEQDYPELIGDALQSYFGVPELREFVKDLLTGEHEKVLSRWKRRGLRIESPPIPDDEIKPEDESNGNEEKQSDGGAVKGAGGHRGSEGGSNGGSSGGHGGRGGGSGLEHERLRERLARSPDLLGPGLTLIETEHVFPSNDKVDILFKDGEDLPVTVEVETHIPPNNEVGMWQAVKYKHLAAVQYAVPCERVRSILAAPTIPNGIKQKCASLGVEPKEVPLT